MRFPALAALVLGCSLLAAGESPFAAAVAPGTHWERGDQVLFMGDHRGIGGNVVAWVDQLRAALPGLRDELQLAGVWAGGDIVAHLPSVAESRLGGGSIDVAVIISGANDAQAEKPVEAAVFEQSLLLGIKPLVASGSIVVLATPMPCGDKKAGNPLDERLTAYAAAVKSVATQTGAHLCDLRALASEALVASNPEDKAEGVFSVQNAEKRWCLTAAGHRFAAERIAQALGEALAKAPLQIEVRGNSFASEIKVPIRLRRLDRDAAYEIRYTVDGKDPAGKDGKPYKTPVLIRDRTTLKVAATDKSTNRTATLERTFSEVKLKPADRVTKRERGLRFELFQGSWGKLPVFDELGEPAFKGVWNAPDLEMGPEHPEMPAIREKFALRFSGLVEVPCDGVYTFHLGSDDGSRLVIGDSKVVDNDGGHPFLYKSGDIGLKEGLHEATVTYYQGGGGLDLRLQYEGPGIRRTNVPDAAWWHDGKEKPKPVKKPEKVDIPPKAK